MQLALETFGLIVARATLWQCRPSRAANLTRDAERHFDEVAQTMPVELPTEFDLVVNVKTAKTLELTVSKSLALRASEPIQ